RARAILVLHNLADQLLTRPDEPHFAPLAAFPDASTEGVVTEGCHLPFRSLRSQQQILVIVLVMPSARSTRHRDHIAARIVLIGTIRLVGELVQDVERGLTDVRPYAVSGAIVSEAFILLRLVCLNLQ